MDIEKSYFPNSMKEVLDLLYINKNAIILGGGTDLVLQLLRREKEAQVIVGLDKLEELKEIREEEDSIFIGSMVTFTTLAESNKIKNYFQNIYQCAKAMGSPQIRNMATAGGNIINAGSAADIIPCLMSLEGELIFSSFEGERRININRYFMNYSIEKIKAGEVLKGIMLHKAPTLKGFYKLGKRNSLAIARLSSSVSVEVSQGRVIDIKVALGAVGRFPIRAIEYEHWAVDKNLEELVSEEGMLLLSKAVENSIPGRKTLSFKREAVKGVFKEAYGRALDNVNY